MGDEVMNDDYPENDQRAGICYSQWRNRNKVAVIGDRETKTMPFELKAIDDAKGEFEGYAAVFREKPDKVGDIIEPGAFQNTIKANDGRVAIFWMHDPSEPLGMAEISEDSHGLFVKGKLTRGVQRAEEALLLMKDKVVKTMSIGYTVVKRDFVDGVRHLQELDVPDITLVAGGFAADDQALITSVKSMTYPEQVDAALAAVDALLSRTKSLADLRREEGRSLSEKHMEQLEKVGEVLVEVKTLLADLAPVPQDTLDSLWLQWKATEQKIQEYARQ